MRISAKQLSIVVVISIIQFIFIGCGTNQQINSRLSDQNNPAPLFVVMGGNTTCRDSQGVKTPKGMDMINEVKSLMRSWQDKFGTEPNYLISCYAETADVHYYGNSDHETLHHGTRAQFRDAVNDQAQQGGAIFLIGHSYGGWLAMKTVYELAGDLEFTGLFTIDPISRKTCNYESPLGCISAPEDIIPFQRTKIRRKTQKWLNFYQSETWYLHSSHILQAHANFIIPKPHTDIDTEESVWLRIKNTVLQLNTNYM
jgi:hypothetical protein